MTQDINPKIIEKIEKLLRLATNNSNEAEAQAAMAKAQEMLEAYNLDMAQLGGEAKNTNAKRKDQTKSGGLYTWQRNLWKGVAELNFCHYLSIKGLAKGSKYEHRLIGSHANVIATTLMADYLQATVEKLAQKWAKEQGYKSVFVQDAIAYREGMTNRICERLSARRRDILQQEREREEERKAAEARGQASTSSALTLVEVISSEADFNNDYLNGWELGTTAKNRHADELASKRAMAEYEERQRVHKERYENDPTYRAEVDAAKKKQDEWWADYLKKHKPRKARSYVAKAPRPRAQTAEEKRAGLDSYWDGMRDGKNVGIDTQIDENQRKAVK